PFRSSCCSARGLHSFPTRRSSDLADNDGVGDFKGLLAKLDYIVSLGVNTVWLLPFYPSPRLDDGYDIAEYRDVDPIYGSLAEVRDRKSTRLNSSHVKISYAVFCLK